MHFYYRFTPRSPSLCIFLGFISNLLLFISTPTCSLNRQKNCRDDCLMQEWSIRIFSWLKFVDLSLVLLLENHNFMFLLFCFQVAESNQLVSEKMDITRLQKEYSIDDFVYQSKIKVCKPFCQLKNSWIEISPCQLAQNVAFNPFVLEKYSIFGTFLTVCLLKPGPPRQ